MAQENLKGGVRTCVEQGGKYVLVCTGVDVVDQQERDAEGHVTELLRRCGYQNPRVAVWGTSRLMGLISQSPAVALAVNGNGRGSFLIHSMWAAQNEMRREFRAGPEQAATLESLAAELRRGGANGHMRIRGEAGIGKTRLVCEVTRAPDLQPLVVYCESPSELVASPLLSALLRQDTNPEAILVVDECDSGSAASLWNQLEHVGTGLRLVTIYNDFEERSGTTVTFDAKPLDDARIEEIIASYGVPRNLAGHWTGFCNGSPRAAHLVGQNLQRNPDDVLRSPDTVNVWDRYIAGEDDVNGSDVRDRRIVLRHVALFKRFGFGEPVSSEARVIAELVARVVPDITWLRFCEVVNVLRQRKVLQGETTLYITPRLLHIKLWAEWWEQYGAGLDLDAFASSLPPRLASWFEEMFKYARESKAALYVTERLLGPDGPFRDSACFERGRSAEFFLALTDAAPKASLECLRRTLGPLDADRLMGFREGRRQVVWALEKIAVWRELFPEAARLLLALAEAENESFSNNATGVFVGLFSLGYGGVAPTEAPPAERLPILREALGAASGRRREIGILACEKALEADHFSRMVGAEYQGLRRPPQLWMPKTWEEVFSAYRAVWMLVVERLRYLPGAERDRAVKALTSQASGVSRVGDLDGLVVDTMAQLVTEGLADRKTVIELVEGILHYQRDDLTPEKRSRWEGLRTSLIGTDFHSRMERFVGMELLEDSFDERGQYADQLGPKISALAEEAIEEPGRLAQELPWLVSDEAKSGYRFGLELGQRDRSLALLPMILQAQRQGASESGAAFLGGYLSTVFRNDPEAWERTLDGLAAEERFRGLVPELTWRAGMTGRAGRRVLALVEAGYVPATVLGIFRFGAVIRQVPEHLFLEWEEFLLRVDTRASVATALTLFSAFYKGARPKRGLPRELTQRLLLARPFFEEGVTPRGQMEEYEWTELAKAHLDAFPDDGPRLAAALLTCWGTEGTIAGGFHNQAEGVLSRIAAAHPHEVWRVAAGLLGPPVDSRGFHVGQWLRNGGLTSMAAEDVWEWIESDIEERAWYAATLVPPVLSEPGVFSWARELLERYGDREDVRRNLQANFRTESWTGPASTHLEGKKRSLEQLRLQETDLKVRSWLDEFITILDAEVRGARVAEERDEF